MKRDEESTGGRACTCPYCEEEIEVSPPMFCRVCRVSLRYCRQCGIAVKREAKVCPACGGELEWRERS